MTYHISFEIAKLLKEKGFNKRSEPYRYNIIGELTLLEGINAPTIAEVVMWLYEKHGIWIYTRPVLDNDGEFIFKGYVKLLNNFKAKEYQTKLLRKPKEAYEAAILYCLTKLI